MFFLWPAFLQQEAPKGLQRLAYGAKAKERQYPGGLYKLGHRELPLCFLGSFAH